MLPKSSWPFYEKKTISKVSNCLKSGKVNYHTGNNCKKFENLFSKKFGVKYCLAVTNGTVALDIAIRVLDIKSNQKIITTPKSYFSSSSQILRNNIKLVYSDISLVSQNLDPDSLNSNIDKDTKAVIFVHLGGNPNGIVEISEICKKNKIFLIEDCSQAHGAKIKNKYAGSFGDISIWSFCNDKIISTGGEGGMIATNKKSLFFKIWAERDIGKNYNKFYKIYKSQGYKYLHDYIGTNARMTEVQAIIGIEQLKVLSSYIKIRNENAKIILNEIRDYKNSFFNLNLKSHGYTNSYYRLILIIKPSHYKRYSNRDKILKDISLKNYFCQVGGCSELYLEKPIKKLVRLKSLENAKISSENSISFIVDNSLKKIEVKNYSKVINRVLSKHLLL